MEESTMTLAEFMQSEVRNTKFTPEDVERQASKEAEVGNSYSIFIGQRKVTIPAESIEDYFREKALALAAKKRDVDVTQGQGKEKAKGSLKI